MKNNCKDTCEVCLSTPGVPCVNCETINCYEVFGASCVIYRGDQLECFGIKEGASINDIIVKVLEAAYINCNKLA